MFSNLLSKLSENFNINSLLSDEFVSKFTNFSSVQQFLENCPIDLNNLQNINSDELNHFISKNTQFSNFDELKHKAFEFTGLNKFGL